MTGITKDELMQMAREVGIDTQPCPWTHKAEDWVEGDAAAFVAFANAILERAAVECEKTPDWAETRGYEQASKIRALKINTGD